MKLILAIYGVVIIGISGFMNVFNNSSDKTAYVVNAEIYNEFNLKKQLEAKLIKTKEARQVVLDSMKIDVQLLMKRLETNTEDFQVAQQFEMGKRQYFLKEKQFVEENQILSEKYSEEIWNQLNQYIKDYGKENGYMYIYGAEGQGSLMYAAEEANITAEVIEYANSKYEGYK